MICGKVDSNGEGRRGWTEGWVIECDKWGREKIQNKAHLCTGDSWTLEYGNPGGWKNVQEYNESDFCQGHWSHMPGDKYGSDTCSREKIGNYLHISQKCKSSRRIWIG